MDLAIWIKILFAILALPGVLIMIMPTAPGMPYLFILSLVYAIIDKFDPFHWWYLLIFGGLLLISILVDWSAGVLGAKYGGAGKSSVFFGFIGILIGTVLMPPFGGFIGLFIGIFLAEIVTFGQKVKALRAASYSLLGAAIGVLINFLLAIGFYVTFLVLMF